MRLLVATAPATAIPRAASCAASAVDASSFCAAGQECCATETREHAMKRVTGDIIAHIEKTRQHAAACREDDHESIHGQSRRKTMTTTMRAATTAFAVMLGFGVSANAAEIKLLSSNALKSA